MMIVLMYNDDVKFISIQSQFHYFISINKCMHVKIENKFYGLKFVLLKSSPL